MNRRGLIITIGSIIFLLAIWYLGIKRDDYQINFEVKAAPGVLYQKILAWKTWDFEHGYPNIETIETSPFKAVIQEVEKKDDKLTLYWSLKSKNDSVTKVSLGIVSKTHAIKNRLGLLFGATDFTASAKLKATEFRTRFNAFLDTYKVKVEGESTIPEASHIYVATKAKIRTKAFEMINANTAMYPKLSEKIAREKQYPFIDVKEWDRNNDSITFHFGFIVKDIDTLPDGVLRGNSDARKALKATFYGNYSLTDAAWFELLHYADRNQIQVEAKPYEIFYDNPMGGGNDKKWKAEIFLPIK